MQVGVLQSVTLKWGVDAEDNGNVPKSPLMRWRARINVCTARSFNEVSAALHCHRNSPSGFQMSLPVCDSFHNTILQSWFRKATFSTFFCVWEGMACSFIMVDSLLYNVKAWDLDAVVKSKARGTESITAAMKEPSCRTLCFISTIQNKEQLKKKLQSHGFCLFTSIISDMGQTNPTCREWHQALAAKQQADTVSLRWGVARHHTTSVSRSRKRKMKVEGQDGNICVVQLVLRSTSNLCSSAAWKRQMFTVAPGYGRCIGLAIWR